MGKTIAIVNQKGGVGKTTTCVNLAAALQAQGQRVLVCDFDPQANTTSGFGVDKTTASPSIYDVLIESQRVLVWTDAGNLLPPDINKDLNRTFLYGAYTPYSGDNINKWVHPLSRRFMALHKMVRKIMPGRGMCDGAYMLIDYNNATVMSDVIIPYVQCAYTRKCITPYGATRKNHRQDQAIITVLMHSAVIKESCNAAYSSQVLTHNDCKQLDKCDLVKQRVMNLIKMVYF